MFALLFISLLILLFYNNHWLGRLIYPIEYQDEINASASQNNVDPHLISAIIRVESNYTANKVSKKGAIGLMQIMPDTAQWVAEQSKFSGPIVDQLTIPLTNIQIGSWYVNSLQRLYEQKLANMTLNIDQIALVAAAYNAGPGNVSKWIDQGIWDGSFDHVNLIPFGETRHFVQRIVYYYKKYERYYS